MDEPPTLTCLASAVKIGFYSTMGGMPWGGSEVLWSQVAHRMLAAGHEVTINYKWWPEESPKLQALRDAGATVWTRDNPADAPAKPRFRLFSRENTTPQGEGHFIERWVTRERPNFVLVTVDYHLSNVRPAPNLIRLKVPYAINLQSASTGYTPEWCLDPFRTAYDNAQMVYCVSQENLDRVETNLAMPLKRTKIIDNPFAVRTDEELGWPSTDDGFRLACVGRIHFQSKGQDVLLNVLKQPKWKERNLKVSLYGETQGNGKHVDDLIAVHGLQDQVQVMGYSKDITSVWANHHGLVLPSRYEGAALAVVEALVCGRICITTDVGRNRELIDEGETGFVASAPTERMLDRALEAAWQKRHQWRGMGQLAGKRIRQRYGADPVQDFTDELSGVMEQTAKQWPGSPSQNQAGPKTQTGPQPRVA